MQQSMCIFLKNVLLGMRVFYISVVEAIKLFKERTCDNCIFWHFHSCVDTIEINMLSICVSKIPLLSVYSSRYCTFKEMPTL